MRNKPAFPRPFSQDGNIHSSGQRGMTIREYYAGLAMQSLIPDCINFRSETESVHVGVAYAAVLFADALIAELEKSEG